MNSKKPQNLRELIEQGYAFPALLPEKNDFLLSDEGKHYRELFKKRGDLNLHTTDERLKLLDLNRLDDLVGYTVPLIRYDYNAKTPLMWNTLYLRLGLNIRNIMVVANPDNVRLIFDVFRGDPKYLGGGLGAGFKETYSCLDKCVPADLKSANIITKVDGKLVGYNTDAQGFVSSLEDKFHEINKEIGGSTIIILGAGGVAKEVAYLLAERKAKKIIILNRSYEKAVALARELNQRFGRIAVGGGEDIIRGYLLNSFSPVDAAINLSDKGSDILEGFAAFAAADRQEYNQSLSRTLARELSRLNPSIIIADIVLPKKGKSITLRIAKNEGLENLLDGIPMVINQAAPAYYLVQEANKEKHTKKVAEQEALKIFKEAASQHEDQA